MGTQEESLIVHYASYMYRSFATATKDRAMRVALLRFAVKIEDGLVSATDLAPVVIGHKPVEQMLVEVAASLEDTCPEDAAALRDIAETITLSS